ncbi:DUF6036 family nucleotidyltransferase [Longispora sp. K20-0274]|uniref:DUF6036 family nucleotidyltransferase n=1 Tax=Longispora sp. K20-0274 TaxID=3088255 RepID=UPI00399BE6FA
MNPLFPAATEAQDFFRENGWDFCLIGGITVMRWSAHRVTKDIDVALSAPYGGEVAVIETIYQRFPARYSDSRELSFRNRVVQFDAANGIGIDIALGKSRRLLRVVARASEWEVEGHRLLTCSAEDLVINKALAGRDKDWEDVEAVIAAQGAALDGDLVMREFTPVVRQGHHLTDPLGQLQRGDHLESVARLEGLLRAVDR